MTYNINLDDLLNNPVKEIKDEALKAKDLKLKLDSGLISESEYNELVNDMARIERVSNAANDLKTMMQIEEAFKLILRFLINR
jgi:hypothetical protein